MRIPNGFHVTGDTRGDAVGLTPEELAEERRAAEAPARRSMGPKPGSRRAPPVQNPFDEILKSLGLWERVQAVCKTRGVAVFELGGTSKARRIHAARVEVYKMLRALDWSNIDIAKLFDKDPSTILSALK
jgi:hypothetical protein